MKKKKNWERFGAQITKHMFCELVNTSTSALAGHRRTSACYWDEDRASRPDTKSLHRMPSLKQEMTSDVIFLFIFFSPLLPASRKKCHLESHRKSRILHIVVNIYNYRLEKVTTCSSSAIVEQRKTQVDSSKQIRKRKEGEHKWQP